MKRITERLDFMLKNGFIEFDTHVFHIGDDIQNRLTIKASK
jgi:hypothetical protein